MPVTTPEFDRRVSRERRSGERRSGADRRDLAAPALALVGDERRQRERRGGGDRRASVDRRLPLQGAADHIHWAIDLIAHVADVGDLEEEELRALDAAIMRLRFALSRLNPPAA